MYDDAYGSKSSDLPALRQCVDPARGRPSETMPELSPGQMGRAGLDRPPARPAERKEESSMTPNPWIEMEMAHRRSAARFGRVLVGLGKAGVVLYLAYALIGVMPQWVLLTIALAVCVWMFYGKKAAARWGKKK